MAEELQSQCYVVSLPEGKDPCDYRKDKGSKKLRRYLDEKAVSIVDFALDVIAEPYDFTDPSQVSRYVEEAAVVLKTVSSPSLRATYAKRVALRSMMSISTIEDAVSRAKSSKSLPQRAPRKSDEEEERETRDDYVSFSKKEEKFLEDMSTNSLKNSYARLLQLSLRDRSLLEDLMKMTDCPKPFLVIAKEVNELPASKPIIVESSKIPLIMETIVNEQYFPYLNQMDEKDIRELFDSIALEAKRLKEIDSMQMKSRRVMEVLRGSSDPELLKIAESEAKDG